MWKLFASSEFWTWNKFFRFSIMDPMRCLRASGQSQTKIRNWKVTSRWLSCRWWSKLKKAPEACLSFSENANSRKNRRSFTFRKFTLRTCVDSSAAWKSSSNFANVCRSSTSEKVQKRIWWCNLNFYYFLFAHPDTDRQCNKQGLKCITKNKGEQSLSI
jgi:hypothetical protein